MNQEETIKTVVLEKLGLSIQLDNEITFKEIEGIYLFEDSLRKYSRNPRTFRISEFGETSNLDFEHNLKLDELDLSYNLKNSIQGSSGNEQHLSGFISMKSKNKIFKVQAWDINNEADATWCLVYLKSLKSL